MKEFTSQICTNAEQSQRLLDLGLNPETADMELIYNIFSNTYEPLPKAFPTVNKCEISAWSLHRLKCLLPTKIPYESGYLTTEIINNVNLMFITDTSEQRVISFIHENLYESMIKCIKWLIKEDYFNKEYLKQ